MRRLDKPLFSSCSSRSLTRATFVMTALAACTFVSANAAAQPSPDRVLNEEDGADEGSGGGADGATTTQQTTQPNDAPPVDVDMPHGFDRAAPARPTFTEHAMLVPPGRLAFEGGVELWFQPNNLQAISALVKWGVSERLELRAGWDVFAVGQTGFGDETVAGIGNISAQAKYALTLREDIDPIMHRMALLFEVVPGIGQEPLGTEGIGLGAYVIWSTFPDVVRVDVMGGVFTNPILDEALFLMPLSGAIYYDALEWLSVFGEVRQVLNFTDLSASGTAILAGAYWRPTAAFAIDASVQVGLTDMFPDAMLQFGFSWQGLELQRAEPTPTNSRIRSTEY